MNAYEQRFLLRNCGADSPMFREVLAGIKDVRTLRVALRQVDLGKCGEIQRRMAELRRQKGPR